MKSLAVHAAGSIKEVVVVDNGSSDETPVECLPLGRALFGDSFRYIRNDENLGFAKASNQGAREASAPYVLFLNNDTYCEADFITPLVERLASDSSLGAVGPLLLYPVSGRVQHCGISVLWVYFVHTFQGLPCDSKAVLTPRCYQAITAAAMVMSASLFSELGGFYEGYVNGYEDLDLCARITEQGLNMACEPSVKVYHHASQSIGRFDHEADNFRLFAARKLGRFSTDLLDIYNENGYELGLAEWLQPYPKVPVHRANALMRQYCKANDPSVLPELLDAEPCWEAGYELLRDLYAQIGMQDHIPGLMYVRQMVCPSLAAIKEALYYAERNGDRALASEMQSIMAEVRERMANPEAVMDQAKEFLQIARLQNLPAMEAAYTEWINDRHGGVV